MNNKEIAVERWPVPIEVNGELKWAGNNADVDEMLKKGGVLYSRENRTKRNGQVEISKQ